MAAVNLQTLALGILRHARSQSVPAKTWLLQKNAEAAAALLAGDTFVTTTGFDGTNSTLERSVNAQQLLEIVEICLGIIEAEEADETPDGSVHYADFSGRRSTWG